MALFVPQALLNIAGNRDTLPTSEAAPAINRQSQTLRKWAYLESGLIRPVLIHGRLADLAALLNGEVA